MKFRNLLGSIAVACAWLPGLTNLYAASSTTFSNAGFITINDFTNLMPGLATPYPSSIAVTGLTNLVVSKVTVQLNGFTHGYPDDVGILLTGPGGQNAVILGNVGGTRGGSGVTNLTLNLDDDAATNLPLHTTLYSGTFKPTNRLGYTNFPPPASPTT